MSHLCQLFFFLICPFLLTAQSEIYKQIAINTSSNPEILTELSNMGIGLRCGVSFDTDGKMLLQLSETEIALLNQNNIAYQVKIENLNATVRESKATLDLARLDLKRDKKRTTRPDFSMEEVLTRNYIQSIECLEEDIITPANFNLTATNYMNGNLTYTEMLGELDEMRQYSLNNNLNIVSVKTPLSATRTTAENRPVYYVRISDNADSDEAGEPESFLTAMHHAREPVGMMNTIFTMWYIIENYGSDPFITNLVNHHELYFTPCVNPDGFQYNVNDRANGGAGFWRKNRRSHSGGCIGTDPNRNYCDTWGLGASSNCNSDIYRGPTCLSEEENLSIRDFIQDRDIKAAINCHTAIPSLFHPYSNGAAAPPNINQLTRWAHDMTRYNRFLYGDGELEGYFNAIGGESDDWMFNTYGIYAFTPELSRSGSFYPPSTAILPDCKEFLRANLTLMAYSGVYAHVHDYSPLHVTSVTGNLEIGIERLGATDGNFTLIITPKSANIQSISNNVQVFNNPNVLDIENNRRNVNFVLNSNIQPFEAIDFQVTLNNGAYDVYSETITKYYQAIILAEDDFDTGFGAGNWTNSGWSTTTSDVFEGTGAVQTGSYSGSVTRSLEWNSAIDLSAMTVAELSFYAHWDIEKIWDYFVLEVSENGGTWTRVCTNYSKPGSPNNVGSGGNSNQPTNEPIIDSQQADWVLVRADLSDYVGSPNPLEFRFRMVTDDWEDGRTNNGNGDGIVVDEFRIAGVGLIPLAVIDLDFSADLNANQTVDLLWSAYTSGFKNVDIERSANGTNWIRIGETTATFFEDKMPLNGKNYYRLKIKKEDATIDYSNVQIVEVNFEESIDIQVFSADRLQITSNKKTSFSYVVFNTIGQVIVSEDLNNFVGVKTLDIRSLPTGIYFVQTVLHEKERGDTERFFVGR